VLRKESADKRTSERFGQIAVALYKKNELKKDQTPGTETRKGKHEKYKNKPLELEGKW